MENGDEETALRRREYRARRRCSRPKRHRTCANRKVLELFQFVDARKTRGISSLALAVSTRPAVSTHVVLQVY